MKTVSSTNLHDVTSVRIGLTRRVMGENSGYVELRISLGEHTHEVTIFSHDQAVLDEAQGLRVALSAEVTD